LLNSSSSIAPATKRPWRYVLNFNYTGVGKYKTGLLRSPLPPQWRVFLSEDRPDHSGRDEFKSRRSSGLAPDGFFLVLFFLKEKDEQLLALSLSLLSGRRMRYPEFLAASTHTCCTLSVGQGEAIVQLSLSYGAAIVQRSCSCGAADAKLSGRPTGAAPHLSPTASVIASHPAQGGR
jgi:hypothetical protein